MIALVLALIFMRYLELDRSQHVTGPVICPEAQARYWCSTIHTSLGRILALGRGP